MAGVTMVDPTSGAARLAPPPAPHSNRRRWLTALLVVWAVALGAMVIYEAKHGRPTVREQTDTHHAQAYVDRAITDALAAAGPDPVAAISGYRLIDNCHVTAVRRGSVYARDLRLYTAPCGEQALLVSIGNRLPARYKATTQSYGAIVKLLADAGDFVRLRGSMTGPGEVTLVADTGCRPEGARPAAEPAPAPADRAAAESLLRTLGVQATTAAVHQVGCIRTVELTGPETSATPLDRALATAGTKPVVATETLFAARSSGEDLAVQASGGVLTATGTVTC
jgi:hypothetical protein